MAEIAVGGESYGARGIDKDRDEDKSAMEIALEGVALVGAKKIRLPAIWPHQCACHPEPAIDRREKSYFGHYIRKELWTHRQP